MDTDRILDNLAAEELPPVEHIVLTHSHWDHARGASAVADAVGATVVAHEGCRSELSELRWSSAFIGSLVETLPEPVSDVQYFSEDTELIVGDLTLRLLTTAGHTRDSVACYLPDLDGGCVFTGDTVLGGGLLGTSDINTDLKGILGAVRRLAELRPECFFPGHGAFTLQSGWVQLELLVAELEDKWSGVAAGRAPLLPTWWLQRYPTLLEHARLGSGLVDEDGKVNGP
jgi:glyoxylase-like metal-dependent hydrolase (beta-lactamase superfamily II)